MSTVKNLTTIPASMKARKQWVVWRYESRKGKLTKPPLQLNGKYAKTDDPNTWTDFETATTAPRTDGIGYVFSEGDELAGVDLDHCILPTGELESWAAEIVELFQNTYIERSPSGDGLHIICKGRALVTGSKKWENYNGIEVGLEVYDFSSPRYFTVTGDAIRANDVINCQSQLERLFQLYFCDDETPAASGGNLKYTSTDINQDEVLSALTAIPPDEYNTWIKVGMALKSGNFSVEIWDKWSSQSSKYEPGECAKKWDTFHGNAVSIKTVFHFAKKYSSIDNNAEQQPLEQASSTNSHPHATLIPNEIKKLVPKKWQLLPEGVYNYLPAKTEGKEDKKIITYVPLWVEAECWDLNDDNKCISSAWIDNRGKLRWCDIPKEQFHGDTSMLFKKLARQGLDIVPGEERSVLKYLSAWKSSKFCRVVNEIGWLTEQIFALPDGTIIDTSDLTEEIHLLQTSKNVKHGVEQKGTLQGWKDTLASLCQGNSRLLFAISASFATPLLHILGIQSGGFNFLGGSSIGKTTAAQIAASVWGSPKFLKSMKATANGLEGIAALHTDLPLLLDEINQADNKSVGQVVYMLANETGKQRADRAGGAREVSTWRTIFFITGELSLLQYIASAGHKPMAGQEVRCLDLPADTGVHGVFENLHHHSTGAKFSHAIKSACAENYGHAGIEFIKQLCVKQSSLLNQFEKFCNDFTTEYVASDANGQVIRVAERIALIAFAGELATNLNITGWQPNEATKAAVTMLQAWIDNRGGQGSHEKTALLAHVRLFFEKHANSRFECLKPAHMKSQDDKPPLVINRAGFYKNDVFYVLPETFQKELIDGFDKKWAIETLTQVGLLIPSKDGPSSNLNGQRVYKFVKVLDVGTGDILDA